MRKTSILLALVTPLLAVPAHSDDIDLGIGDFQATEVADVYVDLRTGPGRGYPVLQSVERGGILEVIKRRTDWFLVRTERDQQGWVHRTQLIETLNSKGERVSIAEYGLDAFGKRTLELGFMAGRFEGANALSGHATWFMTPHVAGEITLMQAIGSYSENRLGTLGVQHYFKPEWRVSPYVGVGVGQLDVVPEATLIASADRSDVSRFAQGGLAVHLLERFMFRLDYRHHLILTNRDQNQEIDEWKAGFAVFF